MQSPKRISEDLPKVTQDFPDQRVFVKLICQNRQYRLQVVPTAATLIIQALKEPQRTRENSRHVRVHRGSITFEDVLRIARVMRPRSQAKHFIGTVKEVVGTALSVGCTIDGMHPREVTKLINEGKYEIPIPDNE